MNGKRLSPTEAMEVDVHFVVEERHQKRNESRWFGVSSMV